MENLSPSFSIFRARGTSVLLGDQAVIDGSRITVELTGGTARSLSSCTIESASQSSHRPRAAQRAARGAATLRPRTRQHLWPPSEQLWDNGKTAPGFRSCMLKEIAPSPPLNSPVILEPLWRLDLPGARCSIVLGKRRDSNFPPKVNGNPLEKS